MPQQQDPGLAEPPGFLLAQEREFHKYYLFGSTGPDLTERARTGVPLYKADSHFAHPSRDTALTSFAQLGVLRLGARRAMISLFDRTQQHVLAEATRTLSLQSGRVEDEKDALWLGGARSIARGEGVCSHVTHLPRASVNDDSAVVADGTAFVVPDLTKDSRFQELALVKDWPQTRFYAGVPIITPKNITIGSYCILDDVPRDGLDPSSLQFMKDIAVTVMSHLLLSRASQEHERGERMMKGLGSFIEGKSTIRGLDSDWKGYRRTPSSRNDDVVEGYPDARQQELQDIADSERSKSNQRVDELAGSFKTSRVKYRFVDLAASESQAPVNELRVDTTVVADKPESTREETSKVPLKTSQSTEVEHVFDRAVNIARESLEVEGIVFFGTSVQSHVGDVSGSGHNDSDTSSFASDTRASSSDDNPESHVKDTDSTDPTSASRSNATCEILAVSTSTVSSINGERQSVDQFAMPGHFLQTLLRRYPRGKLFSFDENGYFSSSESNEGTLTGDMASVEPGSTQHSTRTKTRESNRRAEAIRLLKLFPGARSLAFLPIWDSHRSRWMASTFAWSCLPRRIFAAQTELVFLHALGSSVMGEIYRANAEATNKQNAILASSISHELRSPLHGILGNSELVLEMPLNIPQREMITTIETCGHTLLDVVNHLLDFAKIDKFMAGHKPSRSKRKSNLRTQQTIPAGTPQDKASRQPAAGLVGLTCQVDLGRVVEEVVDAVFAGHAYQYTENTRAHSLDTVLSPEDRTNTSTRTTMADPHKNVTIIIDIDGAVGWTYQTQPGAWRRILMNIFGNSLKHTDKGYIHVKLSILQKGSRTKSLYPSKDTASRISLTVQDTGRGIGKDYLQSHLYTPFSQEDPLSPGNGLGLSIVRSTVKSLGGKVGVQSTKGEGTLVSIGADLSGALKAHPEDKRSPGSQLGEFRGKSMGLIRVTSSTGLRHDAESMLHGSLRSVCEGYLDMKVVAIDLSNGVFPACDYYLLPHVVTAAPSTVLSLLRDINARKNGQGCLGSPVIVICGNFQATQELDAAAKQGDFPVVHCVSQPCGPRKLARALELCAKSEDINPDGPESRTTLGSPSKNGHEDQGSTLMSDNATSDSAAEGLEKMTLEPAHNNPNVTPKAQSPPTIKPGSLGQSMSILIVDDNEINLKLLATFARRQGYEYSTATNGLEALETFRANPGGFKVILMDLTMPVMDGLESTREIRLVEQEHFARLEESAQALWKPATVIAITGVASATVQQDAFTSGVNKFIAKPVRFQELQRLLKSLN